MSEPASTERSSLLDEQRGEWVRGKRVLVEHYLKGRPDIEENTEVLLDLIYGEVVLRREAGELPTPDEYVKRFPALAEPIRTQFEIDDALEGAMTMAADDTDRREYPPSPPNPPPGFELLDELGQGGMGVVYKARQPSLDRFVAIKMIRSGEFADPVERARFEAEARAVGRLSHPNIVQIFEVGEVDGRPYLVLEYVRGESLADALRGPPFAVNPAANLIATLARAIQHAHEAEIVHRDLKPANILIQKSDTKSDQSSLKTILALATSELCPKITDFGLAKRLDSDGLTRTGDFLGTPSYASPEQAAGRTDVGVATDVYSLGAILYHLITGRPPFLGDSPIETLDQVRFAEPVPPSRLRPTLPRDLETIVLKCLQKDPARRYASGAALADDLDRFRKGESILARPTSSIERGWKWARKRPAVATLIGAIVLLVASALITTTILWRQAASARDAEGKARADESSQREQAEADAARLLIGNARLAWMTDDLDAARKSLADCPLRYRTDEWDYMNRACSASRLVIKSVGGSVMQLAYSPDGRRIAGGTGDQFVFLWDAETGEELMKCSLGSGVFYSLAFMPDGRLAVAVLNREKGKRDIRLVGEMALIDPASGKMTVAWQLPNRPLFLVVSPDGRYAANVQSDGRVLEMLDVVSGQLKYKITTDSGPIHRPVFTPDSKFLLTHHLQPNLRVWDVESGNLVHKFPPVDASIGMQTIALRPDGRRLVAGTTNRRYSDELIFFEPDREIRRVPVRLTFFAGTQYSPDGRLVVSYAMADTVIHVWNAETGVEAMPLRGYPTPIRSVGFRPGNRELAAGYRDGSVVIWKLDPANGH